MIGDIDFIIQHKDEQKVEKVLEKNNDNRSQTINLFNVLSLHTLIGDCIKQ